jgi:hypothetical protein
MDKKRFKLTFRQITVHGGGTFRQQRALIIAVSPTQVKGWLQAVLACEDGTMMQKMISIPEFELSERSEVALVEVEGERAAPVIYEVQPADKVG